ncbi:MAG: hypothetical protein CMI62_03710 [Parvibaculum sp.]|jgi:hypothetical protein|uniref:hypothetical protein n=1 Tax=Parvibaculum sp. TaxID=2024848 RepID=UPI000C507D4B|nr:hypothetical protein [Parvibaculum sp.]MAU59821.1 hypothetical protein [Parvibaculum sp.]|tara:strand:- start:1513 stop:2088 length:576 start_codon:yes stop_codon:yes gene_type:complete
MPAALSRIHGHSLKEAIIETSMAVVFSTIPLWLFPLFSPIIFNVPQGTGAQLVDNVRGGELFLYAVATLGPILYLTTYKYLQKNEVEAEDGTKSTSYEIDLPLGRTLAVLSALMAIGFGAIFGSIRLNFVVGSPLEVNQNGTIFLSLLAYSFSILCFCTTTYFRNCVTNGAASDLMRSDEANFLAGWRKRK